jgi:hypothetical protein
VLDVTGLSDKALTASDGLFTDISKRDLLPAHRLDVDSVRRELDERFGTAVLGLPRTLFADGGPVDLLRQKLAAEPSVRGSKSTESAG